MKAYEYITSKQIQWAHRNGIILIEDKGNWGRKAYTQNLNDNLFEPLPPETKKNIKEADGGKLPRNSRKM